MSDAIIYVLPLGKLSAHGREELARRVKAGEPADRVEAELLQRERKAIVSGPWVEAGRSEIDGARERRDLGGSVTVDRAPGPGAGVAIGIDRPPPPKR